MTAKLFWPSVVVGWLLIGVGIVGVAGEGRDVPVAAFARWVIGLVLVHDLVVVPLVLVVGALLRRAFPAPWRAAAAGALVVAGPVVLFAWPYVAGWGRSRSNPSIQPRDYGDGLVVLLAVIAVATVAVGVGVGVARRRREVT